MDVTGETIEEAAPPAPLTADLRCRSCGASLTTTFVDLGLTPLANSYVPADRLLAPEPFFPLHVFLCTACMLVQLPAVETPENIFSDYAYFSSYSSSWLDHARRYVEDVSERFSIGSAQTVVEVASNDGYLLQYFRERGVPVLGIEPAANVAAVARDAGIPTVVRFFGRETARALREEGRVADLLVGNNVLAHVPDLNDFLAGLAILLADGGVLTMEFPHLLRLIEQNQFDTIYHEHYSYLSLLAVERAFERHGLALFDVEELPTHGGSLRIYARHAAAAEPPSERLVGVRRHELSFGLDALAVYAEFGRRVRETKLAILEFVLGAQHEGKRIVAYGAAAKGNTLLNYCGIGSDLVEYVVDRSPHKQGRYLPGTRIPIRGPEAVHETRPEYLLILPWNLRDEIMEQMKDVRDFGCRFVVPIPEVRIYD